MTMALYWAACPPNGTTFQSFARCASSRASFRASSHHVRNHQPSVSRLCNMQHTFYSIISTPTWRLDPFCWSHFLNQLFAHVVEASDANRDRDLCWARDDNHRLCDSTKPWVVSIAHLQHWNGMVQRSTSDQPTIIVTKKLPFNESHK